ncbi:hypothetical protein QZH41_015529, partial [Actinostola sp. cb2023]
METLLEDGKPPVVVVDNAAERSERWGRKAEFIFACVGFVVGYGNIWRFPYMCFKNGGGAFLVPYLLFLVLAGVPLFVLEQSVGQYTQAGPINAWRKICPLLSGIGYSMIAVSFLVSVYYNVIMTWSLYYFYYSFHALLPWVGCDHDWNTDNCLVYNSSNPNATGVSSSREFFVYHVLKISKGIDQPGPLNTPVTLCLLAAWVIVYFCIFKGVRTTGKVVYVTATAPYIILIIFFFRGVTLPGAKNGILFYLIPSFTRLSDPKVWIDAATQILYSLALGLGVHLTFASYNPRKNNIIRDSMLIAIINCVTSVFAGLVIFSVVGFMAHQMNKSVEEVASQGNVLDRLKGTTQVAVPPWTIMRDSRKYFPDKLSRYRELVVLGVCLVLFLLGLSCVTHGGIYVFNLFDSMSAGLSLLFIVMAELIAVAWLFGAERFAKEIQEMTGRPVWRWWVWCWKYIVPVLAT